MTDNGIHFNAQSRSVSFSYLHLRDILSPMVLLRILSSPTKERSERIIPRTHERTATERYHEQLSFTIPMHSSQPYKKQSSKTFSWSRTTSWSQESQTASLFQEGQSSNVDIRSCDQDNRQSSFCYS